MSDEILILGGSGNFGKRIAELLTREAIPVIIAGRDRAKLAAALSGLPAGLGQAEAFDVDRDLGDVLARLRPRAVVNTCGPFQDKDYGVARTCIDAGTHYIDIADGRDFVTGIAALDLQARARNVAVVSGASTVPALTAAVIEHLRPAFASLDRLRFGIAPGARAERGLATTQAIMGYAGRPLKPCAGAPRRHGWQDLHRQTYPVIGARWMANCDVPDLDLLPARYDISDIGFAAGLEIAPLHLGVWMLSWLIRAGLPIDLKKSAPFLLAASRWFDRFGSADGGMHVVLSGRDHDGRALTKRWFIVARDGHGPYIPTVPAVVLARRIARGETLASGATPCVGLVSLAEYLAPLAHLDVRTYEAAETA